MKTAVVLFTSIYFLSFTLYGQNFTIKLGSNQVAIETIQIKTDTILFLNLHSDEQTSISAIKRVLPEFYGKYVGLKSDGKREVSLYENGKSVIFDPNRIFTPAGIEKTLRHYACFSESNVQLVGAFSKELLKYLSKSKLLIALHNNSNGSFSATSLLKEKQTKKDALDIFVNPKKDADDFYYVTKKSKFDYFKSQGYNVILQDNSNVENDGSLSVWCGKNGIDYINIECQDGHLQEQMLMIRKVFDCLKSE